MAEIDQDKALAALEKLEIEKARRLEAKIAAGEIVLVQTTVVVGAHDEDAEGAVDRHVASLPILTPDGRPIHYDLLVVVTGVPRDPDFGKWMAPQPVSKGWPGQPSGEPARSDGVSSHSPSSGPIYVRTIVSNGNEDDDPGQIAEAWYKIEDGLLVLRDRDDKFITSRALLKNEDPAVLARVLLHERKPNNFQGKIVYPKLGFA